jgi:hypothetical protein
MCRACYFKLPKEVRSKIEKQLIAERKAKARGNAIEKKTIYLFSFFQHLLSSPERETATPSPSLRPPSASALSQISSLQKPDGGFDLSEALCLLLNLSLDECISSLLMLGARSYGARFFELTQRLFATALVIALIDFYSITSSSSLTQLAKDFIAATERSESVSSQLELRSTWTQIATDLIHNSVTND